MKKQIDIRSRDLEIIIRILEMYVPEYDVNAFGSRVTRTAQESSDLDLVVMTQNPLPVLKMADVKEAFLESKLPFKVDVVDWAATKKYFRKIIAKQAVPLFEKRFSKQ